MQIEISCKTCNKLFKTQNCELKKCKSRWDSIRKFCSQKCYRLWRRDFYHPSEISKQKTSDKMKWRPATWKVFEKWHTINNGRKPWNYWKNLYDDYFIWDPNRDQKIKEFSERSRKIASQIYNKVITPWYRTSIEIKLEDLVKSIWLKYMTQYEMLWITTADIYIPDKRLVLYADWDYWHNYPYWMPRDHYITKELKNCNYKVLRFWERDINKHIELIKYELYNAIA